MSHENKKDAGRPCESFAGSSTPRSLFRGPIVKKPFSKKQTDRSEGYIADRSEGYIADRSEVYMLIGVRGIWLIGVRGIC